MRMLLGLVWILAAAQFCFAATIRVPADQPTIQAGIDYASANDTVLVLIFINSHNIA